MTTQCKREFQARISSAGFAREHFAADLAELARGDALDGFAVRARHGDVYIFGATAKGTMNGAYAFVENNSDLIWANRDPEIGTVYTANPDLAVAGGCRSATTGSRRLQHVTRFT